MPSWQHVISGTTTVDFGAFPGSTHATATVTGQSAIVATSVVQVSIRPAATDDHTADEHMVENIRVVASDIVAGTGFTINAVPVGNQFTAFGATPMLYGEWAVGWCWT
jgi:hypothetical protein